jgi:glycoside/pentoside/hexuronide:cation symporter, GPH family
METQDGRIRVVEKFGYGLGDLASGFFWQMFAIFIAKFYTDVFMLGAATMGTMLLITRVGDAFVDPAVGALADRTRTRFGRFRPWLLWMSLPMAITAVLTFTTPDLTGGAKVAYAYLTLGLMMVAYSAINIPYSALLGVLTPSSAERTSITTWRFALSLVPVFIIVGSHTSPMALSRQFTGDENSPRGWMLAMAIYSAIAVLLFLATFLLTRERVQPLPQKQASLGTDAGDLLRNRPWVVLSVVGIAALMHSNLRSTAGVFYFEQAVVGGKEVFGAVMTSGAIAFILGVIASGPIAQRIGKKRFYQATMLATAVSTAAVYWVPTDNLQAVWAAHVLVNLLAAPTAPLIWAMYADTADYSEWKGGRRATGLVFSAASFTQKLGWALGGAGVGWLLALFGYVPGAIQSASTVHGITLMMSLVPAIPALVACLALHYYELDEPTVSRMGRDLAAARAAGGE